MQIPVPAVKATGIRGKVLCLSVSVWRTGFSASLPDIFFVVFFALILVSLFDEFGLADSLAFTGGLPSAETAVRAADFAVVFVSAFLPELTVFFLLFAVVFITSCA